MKSKISAAILVSGIMFIATSCSSGFSGIKDAEGFPPEVALVADSVVIDEVLQPQSVGLCGGYSVVYSPKTSKVVFRYRLPGWEFVDSSFVRGAGPDDISQFYMQRSNRDGDILWVSSGFRTLIMKYQVSDRIRRLATISLKERLIIWPAGNVYNDSLLYFSTVNTDEEKMFLYAISLTDTVKKVDSLLCMSQTEVARQGGGMHIRVWNRPEVFLRDDRAVLWYSDTENMVTYRLGKDGRMTQERIFGDSLSYDGVQKMDLENIERDYSQSLLAATDGYVYFLHTRYDRAPDEKPDPGNPRKVVALEIKVYDWDINPVKKYSLDQKEATNVLIDEPNGKIYAYDRRLDFDRVYTYDYQI